MHVWIHSTVVLRERKETRRIPPGVRTAQAGNWMSKGGGCQRAQSTLLTPSTRRPTLVWKFVAAELRQFSFLTATAFFVGYFKGSSPDGAKNRRLLNNWKFVYFVCGLFPRKRRVVRWRNFAHRRATTMGRTSVGFLCLQGLSLPKIDIFKKTNLRVGLQFCSGRSAG